jgi:hypothetical protein
MNLKANGVEPDLIAQMNQVIRVYTVVQAIRAYIRGKELNKFVLPTSVMFDVNYFDYLCLFVLFVYLFLFTTRCISCKCSKDNTGSACEHNSSSYYMAIILFCNQGMMSNC